MFLLLLICAGPSPSVNVTTNRHYSFNTLFSKGQNNHDVKSHYIYEGPHEAITKTIILLSLPTLSGQQGKISLKRNKLTSLVIEVHVRGYFQTRL